MNTSLTATRIYRVMNGSKEYLVRASHPSHAIKHVVAQNHSYVVEVAAPDDLVRLVTAGVKVEEAST